MVTTGELVTEGDESKPINYVGNKTKDEFVDMRCAAKSIRYASQPVCRPVSTRRDWQADTIIRSLASEQAAAARKVENQVPVKEVATENTIRPVFDFALVDAAQPPPQPPTSSLLTDRSTVRALLISHLRDAITSEKADTLFVNPSFASLITCLFAKSEDELLPRASPTTEAPFSELCEEGLIDV